MVSFVCVRDMSPPENQNQLKTQSVEKEKPSLAIQFDDGHVLDHLTNPSLIFLTRRLGEFTIQVLRECRSIEHTEHVGTGPPEITAPHIEEAWWVCRRRIRRSRHPILIVMARIVQAFGIAGFGVSIGYLKSTWWGAWVFAACTLATFLGFSLEVYLQGRE
jgi:hypothetical protein